MFQHIKTSRAGESGYYAERARGTCDFWHDSKRYVFKKADPEIPNRIFKNEVLNAFESDSRTCYKISGRYPSYTIETQA